MLDLNFVRENLDAVREALKNRNFPAEALDNLVQLDTERRKLIGESDRLNEARNTLSKEIGELMNAKKSGVHRIKQIQMESQARGKQQEVVQIKQKIADLDQRRQDAVNTMEELLKNLPNLPANDVPIGLDESANVEIRRWGEPREF